MICTKLYMQSPYYSYNNGINNISFKSSKSAFLNVYKKHYDLPIVDFVKNTIKDNSNYLGEGYFKKGYKIPQIDDYVLRIYKKSIENGVPDNKKNLLGAQTPADKVDGVVAKIPDFLIL